LTVYAYPQYLRAPAKELDGTWGKDFPMLSAVKFEFLQRESEDRVDNTDIVYLYLPTTLVNPTNVSWEQKELGFAGKKTYDAFKSGSIGGGAEVFKKMYDNFNFKDVAYGWALKFGDKLTNGGALGGAGLAINPFIKMLFRGIGMRTFEYEFKFTPRDQAESVIIDSIIKVFRRAAHPNYAGAQQYFLTYPTEVQITYLQSRAGDEFEEIPWMNKFKPSVITSLSVNYASAGYYVPMRDGFPSETTLTLQFTENEIIVRDDINDPEDHLGASF